MSKPSAKRSALVAGASGLAGGYMLAHLIELGGWDIVAVSRRKPRIPGDYRHIAVDLVDAADCRSKLGSLTNISHLFYLAITEYSDPGQTVSANFNMFFNLVKTVEAASPTLEHVHLSQGTRWYGNHLGPYKTPTKEDDPRHMPPNFYYDQQDFLEEFQKGKRWTWSVGRPHAVCGFSTGGPMNLTLAIAVYANICKELRLPLSFPGKPGAYTALYQCTDAALLAKAVVWMATDPKCANQAFNITNSDLIRWQNVWPKFANFFEMELAPPRYTNLTRSMADKGPIWDRIVEKNGLQKFRFEEIAAWGYPDGVFASDYDIVSDTSKARRFGFHDLVDTEEMFLRMFSDFRRDRIIP
jgi:nucleoside-diphosphate-sugar epimerase